MFGLGEMNQGLSQVGTEIHRSECGIAKVFSDKLEKVRAVSSYSWTDNPQPTILVPSSPGIVQDVRLPLTLKKDTGVEFINMNSALLPSAPFAPLFEAVNHLEPDYRWPELDILTDRNGFRKLLRWMTGKADRDFRIDMELVGDKTVILNRWEEHNKETRYDSSGYGRNFEVAYSTSPGKKRALGHHRIIEYEFGGMKLMMRFEVDACLPAASTLDLDDLTKGLGGLSITKKKKEPTSGSNPDTLTGLIRIIPSGELVSQDRLVEVTTRSEKTFSKLNWGDPYPQIYLSQTPHLHVAVHQFGTFNVIHKYKLGEGKMKDVHARSEDGFRRLAALLGIIVAKQREAGPDERLTLVCQKGILKVHENYNGISCLPDELLALFGEAGSDSED